MKFRFENSAYFCGLLLSLMLFTNFASGQGGGPIVWDVNGHAYEFVLSDGIGWLDAREAASALVFKGANGYLATVTSQEENDFIAAIVEQAKIDFDLVVLREVWLGAEQENPMAPPDETWVWETCEPFEFTYWDFDEPNDNGAGGEQYLGMWGPDGSGPLGRWNDQGGSFVAENIEGFIVEFDLTFVGDVNQDGTINLLDVAPFVNLLNLGEFQAEADINGDCFVNLLDIAPFVALLTGN